MLAKSFLNRHREMILLVVFCFVLFFTALNVIQPITAFYFSVRLKHDEQMRIFYEKVSYLIIGTRVSIIFVLMTSLEVVSSNHATHYEDKWMLYCKDHFGVDLHCTNTILLMNCMCWTHSIYNSSH